MSYLIKFFFCGIICSFIFPPFLLFPLGFLIFPYLFFLLKDKKIKNLNKSKQFIYGTSFGLGLNIIVLYWVKEPFAFHPATINYSSFSFLLILYISFYFGLLFFILSYFKNDFSKLIMIPVLFVIMEIIRENFLFGFPWITFSLVASGNYYILQLAYFIGSYGLSFFLIFIFLIPSSVFLLLNYSKKFFQKIYLLTAISIFLIFSSLIFIRLNFFHDQNTKVDINLSLNQLNIYQSDKSNSMFKSSRMKEIINIINYQKDTIHIFSETDYPYIIENNDMVELLQKNLSNNNSVIIGGIRKEKNKYYNSLFFISEDYSKFFDKKKLVPFGEFLPFRKNLNFLKFIVGNVDLEKGNTNRLIKTSYNFNFIPVICYEIIFFNDLLSAINNKSPILINITNDAWFGKYSGPYQHFYLSRIRSTELNKFLIRVSNNGVSAIVDNYGKIIDHIPLNKKEMHNLRIKIPLELNNILYLHKLIYLFLIILTITVVIIEKKTKKL